MPKLKTPRIKFPSFWMESPKLKSSAKKCLEICFEKIIGGRYILTNINQDSSTYRHDVDVPVKIVDKNHPITKGMDDFVIHDEVYGNYKVLPSVQPLLQTTHPESGKIVGWTNRYAKSRIVYLQLGHDHYAYENSSYRRLIKQAAVWVHEDSIQR